MRFKRLDIIFCPHSKNESMLRDDNFCYSPHERHVQIKHLAASQAYSDYAILQSIPTPVNFFASHSELSYEGSH